MEELLKWEWKFIPAPILSILQKANILINGCPAEITDGKLADIQLLSLIRRIMPQKGCRLSSADISNPCIPYFPMNARSRCVSGSPDTWASESSQSFGSAEGQRKRGHPGADAPKCGYALYRSLPDIVHKHPQKLFSCRSCCQWSVSKTTQKRGVFVPGGAGKPVNVSDDLKRIGVVLVCYFRI